MIITGLRRIDLLFIQKKMRRVTTKNPQDKILAQRIDKTITKTLVQKRRNNATYARDCARRSR